MSLIELEKAIDSLETALSQKVDEFIRDSVIQRFEFCVELSWKTAKKTLGLSATAPKVVIREMAQQNVISDPEYWFSLLEARNLSSHTYREDLAKKVFDIAKKSLPEFKSLLEHLKRI